MGCLIREREEERRREARRRQDEGSPAVIGNGSWGSA